MLSKEVPPMSDGRSLEINPNSVSRRGFLKATGVGVAGGTIAAMLDARQAPAQIKGTTLRILQWSHFIPAYDTWFDNVFTKEWGEKNGVKVRVDHIPHLELPARMAAEFAAGAGHDLIMNASSILTRLYYKSLVDLNDVYDAAGKKHGGWIPSAGPLVQVEGRTYGIPMFYILLPMLWRKDLFDANNLKAPDTWELARVAARTMKAKGHPTGIQFSQCADANLNWRSLLFSFGGKEAEEGDNILIDSKETREALKFAKALFDEGMTPEVFSWDDASDNRYLASGVACWIHDAISAYRTTEDTNPDVFKNTHIGMEPAGPDGKRVSVSSANVYMVWKSSKNQQAAKEFLTHFLDDALEGMKQSRGYNMPYLLGQAKKPMPVIGADPKMQILQDFPKIVAWGTGEYRRIFAKHKRA
ncbi:MAG: sugar ABC transporter substrate-binding protein [Candidatus Rokuibacteriota bacterium]|nr:MAG: sugar ABC transporter substrate-binding protein [Candidatus Rokubacteria bacterium]